MSVKLKINTKRFKALCAEQRDYHERDVKDGLSTWADYRETLRDEVLGRRHLYMTRRPATAADLKAELTAAAIAAGQQGATEKQIAFIMALAVKANDFSPLGASHFTKAMASRLIDTMKGA